MKKYIIGFSTVALIFAIVFFALKAQAHDPSINWRAGTIDVGILDVEVDVAFEASLSSTNYTLVISPNKAVAVYWSHKTVSGFKLHLATGLLSGSQVDYLAIPYN